MWYISELLNYWLHLGCTVIKKLLKRLLVRKLYLCNLCPVFRLFQILGCLPVLMKTSSLILYLSDFLHLILYKTFEFNETKNTIPYAHGFMKQMPSFVDTLANCTWFKEDKYRSYFVLYLCSVMLGWGTRDLIGAEFCKIIFFILSLASLQWAPAYVWCLVI